ncbi:hypothetical protein AAFF_G00256020 [Aldrovandia affinis]|uniref:Uncharacterized protein n=1 Tax=Aldrovandia affinis TaxID=143900 RepID=A0AAD7W2A7_9TELE|nr:hypothetical protein AAFF_G00256020 [Aldrovandia affinis]
MGDEDVGISTNPCAVSPVCGVSDVSPKPLSWSSVGGPAVTRSDVVFLPLSPGPAQIPAQDDSLTRPDPT